MIEIAPVERRRDGAAPNLKAMVSDSGEVARAACFTFDPPTRPIEFRSEMSCWLIENPTLKALVEGRLRGGNVRSAEVELRVQNSVERGLQTEVSRFKIGIGGELRTITSSTWRFEVSFWPVESAPTRTVTPAPTKATAPVAAPPRAPRAGATLDRQAKTLVSRLPDSQRPIVDRVLGDLPPEVMVGRDSYKGHEYLELTSGIDADWKAWLGPRADEIVVAVYAAPEDTIGWSTTTYARRMEEVGLTDVRATVPEWGSDGWYVNTVLTPTSDPLMIAVAAGYLRWFLVEAPRIDRGPRLAPKSAEWVRAQPPPILEQLDVLLTRLPTRTKVAIHGPASARYLRVESALDKEFVAWVGRKGDRLYVAFDADDRDIVGSTDETYWQKLLALGFPDTQPRMAEWGDGIEGNTINVVIPNEGAAAATLVAEYLAWYVEDAPKA